MGKTRTVPFSPPFLKIKQSYFTSVFGDAELLSSLLHLSFAHFNPKLVQHCIQFVRINRTAVVCIILFKDFGLLDCKQIM